MDATKKFLLSALILINSTCLFAQYGNEKTDAIRHYAYTVDTSKTILDSLVLSFDSIRVDAKIYSDKVITNNYFEKSRSELKIEFFFRNDTLTFVSIHERCPLYNELSKISEFYYENCKLSYQFYYFGIIHSMLIDPDKSFDEQFGYNENLYKGFLEKYVLELIHKITGKAYPCFPILHPDV